MMLIMFSSFKTKKVFNFQHIIYSTGFAICQNPKDVVGLPFALYWGTWYMVTIYNNSA